MRIGDKLPPSEIELERAIIGALIIEKDAINQVVDILVPESFYKEDYKIIYKVILALFKDSEPIDMLTVASRLRKQGELEKIGGSYEIMKLTEKINSASNIEFYARIISEAYVRRELIKIASRASSDSYDETLDIFSILGKLEGTLLDISGASTKKNYSGMKEIIGNSIKEMEAKKDSKGGITGVPSGLTDLDRLTSGWQKSELIIIAARPAMGKSALIVSALRNASVEFGIPVALFSLEMSATQLANRMISAEAKIHSEKISRGNLTVDEWEIMHKNIQRLMDAPIFIDDTPALSILDLRAKCRRLKAQENIQMVVIDYLQLMTASAGSKGNREQEIAQISRALKNLSKELDVPVIALSQLSRSVETRGGDKRPQLSDLRESGSIEQDADIVMFLYRPEYYGITEDENGESVKGIGEIIVAKNRSGSLDNIKLKFIGEFTKFEDLKYSFTNTSINNDTYEEDLPEKDDVFTSSNINGMSSFE